MKVTLAVTVDLTDKEVQNISNNTAEAGVFLMQMAESFLDKQNPIGSLMQEPEFVEALEFYKKRKKAEAEQPENDPIFYNQKPA